MSQQAIDALTDAVVKMKFDDTPELAEKCKTNLETVQKWESGERAITVTNAKHLAKLALIPYGLLFADNPPEEKIPIADYRTQGSAGIRRPSPELLETIDDARLKQGWYREYLISEEFSPHDYIGKFDTDADYIYGIFGSFAYAPVGR